jgi:hypothetical protein
MRKANLILIILFLCIPLPLSIVKFIIPEIKIEIPLDGELIIPAPPVISIKNIFNGSFQDDLEKYYNFNMAGRATMTRLYNEVLYSLFFSTDNWTIMMGKDKYLYTPDYTIAHLIEPNDDKKEELFDNLILLTLLQQKIEEMGKLLLVIVTPSKLNFYPEYLPNAFAPYISMKDRGEYSQNYYEYFVSKVSETGLRYFEFHDEFMELKYNGTDIFTKGGIHWTAPAVDAYFTGLINVLNENTEKKIGTMQTVKAEPVWGNAFTWDDDVERLLNILPSYTSLPNILQKFFPFYRYIIQRPLYYSYHMEVLSIPTDYRPSVFVCGGSFNWAWLHMVYGLWDWVTLGDSYIFSSAEFSFYNAYITKYPENIRIADATDNFYSVMEKDIIIIEFNEHAINPDASQFVFIKNLLNFLEERNY